MKFLLIKGETKVVGDRKCSVVNYCRGEDGKKHVVEVPIDPYFYSKDDIRHSDVVRVEHNTKNDIFDNPVNKIIVKTPAHVRNVRKMTKMHYEADILFPYRMRIDFGIKGCFEWNEEDPTTEIYPCINPGIKPKTLCEDIETLDDVDADNAASPIVSTAMKDDEKDKYICLITTDKDINKKAVQKIIDDHLKSYNGYIQMEFKIMRYPTEALMLLDRQKFIDIVVQPDVMYGWNYPDFDVKYLKNRANKIVNFKPYMEFDLMHAYKTLTENELVSDKLEDVAKAEFGIGKLPRTTITYLLENDVERLVAYNLIDVYLTAEINKKKDVIKFHQTLAEMAGTDLDGTRYNANIVDAALLHFVAGRVALPSKGMLTSSVIEEGGKVHEAFTGIKENVAVVDLSRAYPTTIEANNLSPETKIGHQCNNCKKSKGCKIIDDYTSKRCHKIAPIRDAFTMPSGRSYLKSPIGLIPAVFKQLIIQRKDYQEKMKACLKSGDKTGEKKYFEMQRAVKYLMNSFYGVLGAIDKKTGRGKFRLADGEMGSDVTESIRLLNGWIEDRLADISELEAMIDIKWVHDDDEHMKEVDMFNELMEMRNDIVPIYGDSVAKNTMIMIKDNKDDIYEMEIQDIFESLKDKKGDKEYDFPDLQILTLKDGVSVFRPIKYVMRHKTNKKMYRISITNLWHIDVTEDHSIMGLLSANKVDANNIFDRIIPVKTEQLKKEIKSILVLKNIPRININEMFDDQKLYELFGYFIGNGSFNSNVGIKNYYICLSTGGDLREIEKKLILPLIESSHIKHYWWQINGDLKFNGLPLIKIFNKHFRDQEGNKIIPNFMFKESPANIASFLRGYFSADGSIMNQSNRSQIGLCSVKMSYIDAVRKLLFMIGISNSYCRENTYNTYTDKKRGKVYGGNTRTHRINIKDPKKFLEKVGFIQNRQNEKYVPVKNSRKKEYINYEFDISNMKSVEEIEYDDYVYDVEVEDTHTFFGNEILLHNTDSVLFTFPEMEDQDHMIELINFVATLLNRSFWEFSKWLSGSDVNLYELEFEKLYSVFFQGGKKKRYAGLYAWKKGEWINDRSFDERKDIKGYEIRRSDWSTFSKECQKKLFEIILTTRDKKEVSLALQQWSHEFYSGLHNVDMKVPKGIGKTQYKKTVPIQMRAAGYSNKYLGKKFRPPCKVFYCYMDQINIEGAPPMDVIALDIDDDPSDYGVINYDLMFERQFKSPIGRITETIWPGSWDELLTGLFQEGLEEFF